MRLRPPARLLLPRLLLPCLLLAGLALLLSPAAALAQALTFDLGADTAGTTTGRIVQLIALITVLSLAPSILVMMTSFTRIVVVRSEEHTSELQSLMRISYAVFCLKKKRNKANIKHTET